MFCAETAGIQNHDAFADLFKFMAHFEIIDARFVLDDAFQQVAKRRNIPLAVTKLENRAINGLRGRDVKGAVECGVGQYDMEIGVQNQDGFAGSLDESVGIRTCFLDEALERVDVQESDDGAFDFVFEGFVGTRAQEVPDAGGVAHFRLLKAVSFNRLTSDVLQIGEIYVGTDLTQVASYIRR